MVSLLSVESVLFMVGEYPLSAIEFVGTILYFSSVWLIARKQMLTWPVGIVSVILFGMIFYQIRLYAVAIEQLYYLGASVYGWNAWRRARTKQRPELTVSNTVSAHEIQSGFSSRLEVLVWAAGTLCAAVASGFAVSRFHIWMPSAFPEPAAFPILDGLTTVMSFVAMFLMARRRTECWVYWILVNVASIWLYWESGVRFIALQYVALLGMAVYGIVNWLWTERERSSVLDITETAPSQPAQTGTI